MIWREYIEKVALKSEPWSLKACFSSFVISFWLWFLEMSNVPLLTFLPRELGPLWLLFLMLSPLGLPPAFWGSLSRILSMPFFGFICTLLNVIFSISLLMGFYPILHDSSTYFYRSVSIEPWPLCIHIRPMIWSSSWTSCNLLGINTHHEQLPSPTLPLDSFIETTQIEPYLKTTICLTHPWTLWWLFCLTYL